MIIENQPNAYWVATCFLIDNTNAPSTFWLNVCAKISSCAQFTLFCKVCAVCALTARCTKLILLPLPRMLCITTITDVT